MAATLTRIEIENLHGFQHASLRLDRERTVIVGPNNSGKTAALTLVDWLLNQATDDELQGKRLRPESEEVLLPARETRNSARRLSLYVRTDGGTSTTQLRYRVLTSGGTHGFLRLGPAVRGEKQEADAKALKLLDRVREELRFVHIPSFRDAQSDRFSSTLKEAYRARLEERALHAGRGRARKEYRQLNTALGTLKRLTDQLVGPLWGDIAQELPAGLARRGQFEFTATPEQVLDWLVEALDFRLSTDDHDVLGVGVTRVGAGLQSLLDLAVNASGSADDGLPLLFVVEEPEAFLHPAAQRTLARRLLRGRPNTRIIITTHSPLVVDEARAGDVVLAKKHRFYEPTAEGKDIDEQKRTAIMTGQGAEAMFSHGVLLVEGPGDLLFFEALRRRFAAHDSDGCLDRLHVVEVGGKTQFAPWIRLFNAYGRPDDRPVPWLAVPDADAATAISDAFRDANVSMTGARTPLQAIAKAIGDGDLTAWRQQAAAVNAACTTNGIPLRLLTVDLEEAMLSDTSDPTWQALAQTASIEVGSRGGLMQKLGSKCIDGKSSNSAVKAPWIRGLVGREIPLNELSASTCDVLAAWFSFVMDDAATFVARVCAKPS